jgi:hypothetical protein
MGGGFYERDVPERSYTRNEVFNFSNQMSDPNAARENDRREVHEMLNIKGKIRECRDSEEHPDVLPIVVAMDVTKSRGDDALVVFEKVPLLMGQLPMTGIADHPAICWAAVGDATCGDYAPIQVGQFESDDRLDESLSNLWIEEGGGGTGQESYELLAYYLARNVKMDITEKGEKGFLFFLGDEGFYPKVSKDQVKAWIGEEISDDVSSAQIFEELNKKFHVFFVYPKKSWEDRKENIDSEIAGRVKEHGGMVEGCSIRASLLWNNLNDLDLHVITPSGEHISYAHKNSRCGGYLDIDMNAGGASSMKPVENIRWKKGAAPKGRYRVFVQNYACKGGFSADTEWRAEIEIDGKVQYFEGITPKGKTGSSSDTTIFEFDYDPKSGIKTADDDYALYKDEVITEQWGSVLEHGHLLEIDSPKACVDAMIGAIALKTGKKTMEEYLEDMKGRGQTESRCDDVKSALGKLSPADSAVAQVDESFFV